MWNWRVSKEKIGCLDFVTPVTSCKLRSVILGLEFPAEALPHLFDRFYRVDPARTHSTGNTAIESATGSGLGLAIAQAIVEHHQGQIQVESTIGKGTTFIVTLPITLES